MKCERWTRNYKSCSRRLRRKKVDEMPLADGFLVSTKEHNPSKGQNPLAGTKMLQPSAFRLPVVQLSQSFTAFHRFTHRIFPIVSIQFQWVRLQSQHKKWQRIQSAWGCHKPRNHWYYISTMSNVIPPNPSQQIWIQHPPHFDHYLVSWWVSNIFHFSCLFWENDPIWLTFDMFWLWFISPMSGGSWITSTSTRHWFPIASTLELDPKRPTPVRLDGLDLVVWQAGKFGGWNGTKKTQEVCFFFVVCNCFFWHR